MIKLKDFLYFYRILNWETKISALRPLGYLIFGYLIASRFEPLPLFFNSLAIIGVLVSSYSLNDYFDWKNQGEDNFLSKSVKGKKLSEKQALLLTLVPLILVAGLVFVKSGSSLILFAFGLFLAFAYSSPPFNLKQKKFFGLIAAPTASLILFLQGFLILGQLNQNVILLAIVLLFFQLQSDLLHILDDSLTKESVKKLNQQKALFWLKRLPLVSLCASLIFSLINPIFIVSFVFSLRRYLSLRSFKLSDVKKVRRNLLSQEFSLYEFGIYGLLAVLGLFNI